MAGSYRNNQFVSDWLKPDKNEWQNAPYQYPRRIVRHTTVNDSGEPVRTATKLDRGFMRNLMTETVSTSGVTTAQQRQRFNFQFNPEAIQQEVQMRQDIYLPILQQPEQFAQPMSAVATFNFQLLLDRTMEVGSAVANSGIEERRFVPYVDLFGEANPATDVYQIGVLSDLQVLYSIIGQGFSNKFIESQLEQLKIQARQEALNNEDLGVTEADINSITSDTFAGAANFGNNAFLIPMPVRVVFSELFMVDGFVTSTSVRFTKFNTNMVPIQASIGLSMNALYIGFAKQKTFLTVQLENAKNNRLAEIAQTTEENNEILTILQDSASRFLFSANHSYEFSQAISSTSNNTNIIKYAIQGGDVDDSQVQFKIGFKDAKTKGPDDKVLQMYKSGKPLTISYSWSFNVYGPYDTQADALKDSNKRVISNESVSAGVQRRGYYSGSYTAASADDWEKMRGLALREDAPETNNLSTNRLPNNSSNDNKYFVVNFKTTITANGVSKDIDDWRVVLGTGKYYLDIPVGWPAPSPASSSGNSGVSGTGYANDNPLTSISSLLSF